MDINLSNPSGPSRKHSVPRPIPIRQLIRYLLDVKDRVIVGVIGNDCYKSELGDMCEENDTKNRMYSV